MTKLYPIGTQLITRRLSQAALYDEIFCWKTIESCVPGGWEKGFSIYGRDRDDYITQWRITVTAENQKWLSPVPIVGDLVLRPEQDFKISHHIIWQAHNMPESGEFIEKRTYPNGQRAPLLEWDEVILPQQGASS